MTGIGEIRMILIESVVLQVKAIKLHRRRRKANFNFSTILYRL